MGKKMHVLVRLTQLNVWRRTHKHTVERGVRVRNLSFVLWFLCYFSNDMPELLYSASLHKFQYKWKKKNILLLCSQCGIRMRWWTNHPAEWEWRTHVNNTKYAVYWKWWNVLLGVKHICCCCCAFCCNISFAHLIVRQTIASVLFGDLVFALLSSVVFVLYACESITFPSSQYWKLNSIFCL